MVAVILPKLHLMNPPAPPIAASSSSTLSDAAKRILPWLVAVAFFMESLDTTILNTAVPAISSALGVGPLSMKAVLASYTLSLAVFIPISGWMADRFGTRRVFASAHSGVDLSRSGFAPCRSPGSGLPAAGTGVFCLARLSAEKSVPFSHFFICGHKS